MKERGKTVPPSGSEVSERLAEQTAVILDRWEARVREQLPASRSQTPPFLRDHLPVFLLQLADALSPRTPREDACEASDVCQQHARERARLPEYSLDQVVREYSLLRSTLLQVLEAKGPIPLEQRETIHRSIDRAMEEASTEFARVQGEKLARSEEQQRLLVESAIDHAIFMMDPEGKIISWNSGAAGVLGYQAEEILGQPTSLIFTPQDRAAGAPEQERETAAREGRAEDERWHLRKDGSRFWASGAVCPIRDETGTLRGFGKVMRDQTARKQAEEERSLLLEREQAARQQAERTASQLRRLHTVTDVALANLELDQLLGELLGRLQEVLGVDTAAVLLLEGEALEVRAARGLEGEVKRHVSIPVGRGFVGRVAATRAALFLPEVDPEQIASPMLRKAGVRSLLGVPLLLGERLLGVLHVGTLRPWQISEEDTQLLRLVAERVALAIDRTRLVEALQDADRRKNEFLAMLAHEMRTPISAISNAVYILENLELPDARGVRQLGTVDRQTRHLARLAEDLLDVARITQGKLELRRHRLDLAALVREAAQGSLPLIEARGQEFFCDVPSEHFWIEADAVRLEQVVTNLLNNAAKYTEAGGTIWLSLQREGEEAVLRVRDTGVGIDPVLLPQVFDLFMQVDPSGAHSRGGLGIGLTLVRRLVELHGGSITVRSSGPGQGTEFVVCLPLPHHTSSPKTG